MSLLKDLLDAKQLGLESETNTRSAYAGHAFENEMIEIDAVVSMFDIGTEGQLYTDIDLAPVLSAYGIEGEDGNVTLDFTKEFEGLGLESVTEKIKSAGTKTKDFFKKMGKIIVGFVKRMINILVNKNLTLKKYGAVVKKLLTKIEGKTFKDGEKKLDLHEFDGLEKLLDNSKFVTKGGVQSMIKEVKNSKKWLNLYDTVVDDIWLLTGSEINGKTPEQLDTIIKDKSIIKSFQETIEGCDPKAKEYTCNAAKTKFASIAKDIEKYLGENIDIQSSLREYADVLEKKVTELTNSDSLEKYAEGAERDAATEQYKILQKMGSIIAQSQAAHTKLFKHTAKCLGTLISDMKKVAGA